MIRVLALTLFACSMAASQSIPDKTPEAILSLIPLKHRYRIGEPILVKYELKNVGEIPFYVPKGIYPVGNARGCVMLEVYDEERRTRESVSEDQSSDYWKSRDIKEEIRVDWLLLAPGQFYGMEARATSTTLKPGHYWIAAKHESTHMEPERSWGRRGDWGCIDGWCNIRGDSFRLKEKRQARPTTHPYNPPLQPTPTTHPKEVTPTV